MPMSATTAETEGKGIRALSIMDDACEVASKAVPRGMVSSMVKRL